MTAAHEPQGQGHDPAAFDRIVSRLRAENPGFADYRRFAPPTHPPIEPKIEPPTEPRIGTSERAEASDGPFVLTCLAVILPMSMVVGGWIGLMVMLTAVVVAARLTLPALVDQPR